VPTGAEAFWLGLGTAALAAGAVAATWAAGPRRGRLVPVAGLVLLIGWLVGLSRVQVSEGAIDPDPSVLALVLLGVGSVVPPSRGGVPLRAVALLPGAFLLAMPSEAPTWAELGAVVAIVIGTLGLGRLDRVGGAVGAGPVLVAVSVAGVWVTVPETDAVVALLGAAVPFGLLAFPYPLATVGRVFGGPVVGALVWNTLAGGVGRDGALVGGLASLGLCLIVPFVDRRADMAVARSSQWRTLPPLVAVHTALVLYAARIAGQPDSGLAAAVLAAVGIVVVGFVLVRTDVWRAMVASGGRSEAG
jgi:hypothetical protein